MKKKTALVGNSSPDGDVLQDHWLVDDMFSFENVGFTKDVGNIKFLVCADCEVGPIGWHCLDDKKSFYVALDRVSHEWYADWWPEDQWTSPLYNCFASF